MMGTVVQSSTCLKCPTDFSGCCKAAATLSVSGERKDLIFASDVWGGTARRHCGAGCEVLEVSQRSTPFYCLRSFRCTLFGQREYDSTAQKGLHCLLQTAELGDFACVRTLVTHSDQSVRWSWVTWEG